MNRHAVLLAFVALAAAAAPAGAVAPRCDAGVTLFKDGALRLFAIPFSDGRYASGTDQYACLGRNGRAVAVGGTYSDATVASTATPAYVWDGARYLAAYRTSDSEGGPDASLRVVDLRRRRGVSFTGIPYGDRVPAFRVTAAGELLRGRAVALTGTTAYRMAGGEPRSTTVAGPGVAGENRVLAPVVVPRSRCGGRGRGRTLAQFGPARVLVRDGRRRACRWKRSVRLPDAGRVQIVAGRWVVTDGAGVTVHDLRTERLVATAPAAAEWTVLRDGTLAWTDGDGTLRIRDEVLAEGASALASSGRRLYWTAGGVASTRM